MCIRHQYKEVSTKNTFNKVITRFKCIDCLQVIESIKDKYSKITTHTVIRIGNADNFVRLGM